MNPMAESLLFIQALLAHMDRLRELLGDQWPAFEAKLQQLLAELNQAQSNERVLFMVDEIFDLGLNSPAAELVRSLFNQAAIEAGSLDSTTRSVPMTDPTSGQSRDVMVSFAAEATPKGIEPTISREDVIASGQMLAQALEDGAPKEALTAEPETRYFNVFFTEPDSQATIPPDQPLVHSQAYSLFVDISPERAGLGGDEATFPEQALAECWDDREKLPLTVWAASRDFEIEPHVRTLELPRQGPTEGIRFTVRPLLQKDWGYIQVGVYYRGHLLQSKRVEALIVPAAGVAIPTSLRPIQTARLTFTATARLDPDNLARFPARVFTVDVERDPRDGSFDLRFLDHTSGQATAHYDTHLQPEALGQAIDDARVLLKLMVMGSEKPKVEGYLYKVMGDDALLAAWLPRLANVGRNLYRRLLPETGGQPTGEDQGEKLRAALQPGAVIQVNPVVGVVTIPWMLLYERRVKYLPDKTRLCEGFAACGPDCAGCLSADDPYIVCPYAFWGYRYAIEQLPCWVSGESPQLPVLIRQIGNGRPLVLNMNVWRDFSLWRDHRDKIKAAGEVEVLVAEEVLQLETIWATHSPHLDVVYFYSHGGVDAERGPYLKLSDALIDSNFLEASELAWPHAPLIFLNGCATGDYGPESYISLIEDFRAAGASGIVGTECPVPELFAEAYAGELFPRFFRGERLGRAMLEVRLNFLKQKKNPLGLLYTLYAAHDISLTNPVALI